FHFHRIFGAIMGETLGQFIQRVRVEKAASKLIHNPKKSITQIALECGFSSSATFARAFKDAFHMSASEWRSGGYLQDRKIGKTQSNQNQALSKTEKDFDVSSSYTQGSTTTQVWRIVMKNKPRIQANVEVKDMPEMNVAYVRHIGPYKGNATLFASLWERLMRWAGPRGLVRFPETRMLSVYYDDPEITTDESKLRVDVCITVPADTRVDGEIGKMTISGGKCAVARFEIGADEYQDAWDAVFAGWLPGSGYQPADGPCYELYWNDPEQHPEKKHIVDICVPVKPL
ncbi:MAG: AraC family transcriptional regulator, partial [Chloroflexi bacterium]|nr:AraC family transcriptional regulator [Chloroflexota bacterium]